jgi:SAM-dependent methyltransferase
MDQIQQSYQRQAATELETMMPSRYARPASIDNWRHTRMLDLARAVWRAFPGSRWMTVGDGRYGSDAAYLHAEGIPVVATSLTEEALKHAQQLGHIAEYRVENAEAISLPNDSFEFVLCKESYHHFPRPPIALYEMLRVSRIGVVLIEPFDNPRVLDRAKRLFKTLIRGDREHQFEPSGNYLYRLNLRELAKLMTAMGGQVIAFKGLNDFYHSRLADYDACTSNMGSITTRFGIWVQDKLANARLLGFGLACVVVFKSSIEPAASEALKRAGFTILELPRNPYANP